MTTDANIIKIKRSGTSGAPSSLKLGELAYSYLAATGNPTGNGGDRLFIGANGTDPGTGNANDIVVIGGKYFTDLLDHTRGTLTASSALIADSNSVIDRILTTGLNIGGTTGAGLDYTISTDNNNNLVLSTGLGKVSINGAYTLPNADGTSGYVLTTNGSGVVSWAAAVASLTVDADSGGPQTVNLLTDTLTTTSADGNIATSVAKVGTTVTTTLDLAADLTGIDSVSSGGDTGAVNINTSPDGTTNYHWQFNTDGSFILPSQGLISEAVSPSGVGHSIILTPYGGTDSNQKLLVYPGGDGDGNHLHLTTSALGTTSIFLGNDSQYVRTRTDGAMVIGTNDTDPETSGLGNRWVFNTDGTTKFPGFTFPAGNGTTGQVLVANASTGILSWGTPWTSAGYALSTDTFYIGSTEIALDQATGTVSSLTGINAISSAAGTGAVTLNSGGDNSWVFGTDGSLSIPATGGGAGVITAGTNALTLTANSNNWELGADGTTYFPNYTFPAAHGSSGQVLVDDGSGVLSWTTVSSTLYIGTTAFTTGNSSGSNTTIAGLTEIDVGDLVLSSNTIENGNNATGNVQLIANGGSADKTFTFGTDGSLTFPQYADGNPPTAVQYFGMGNLFAETDGNYTVIGTADPATGASNYAGIGIMPGIESQSGVYIPNDTLAGSAALWISNNNSDGRVQIEANSHSWYFNADGTTQFPHYTFPSANGADGQVLTADAATGNLSWTTLSQTFYIGSTQITTGNNSGDITTIAGLNEIDVGDLVLSGSTVSTGADAGDVTIVANTGGTDRSWVFDGDGVLTLPVTDDSQHGGKVVFPSSVSGTLATINYNGDGGGGGEFALQNTDGTHTLYAGLNLDGQAITFSNTTNGVAGYSWTLNSDGTTAFPNYLFPAANGADGQVLTANASTGHLAWTTLSQTFYIGSTQITTGNASGDVTALTGINSISSAANSGNVTLNASGGHQWTFNTDGTTTFNSAYTLPASDGTDGYVLTTNGDGVVTWAASAATLGLVGDSGTGSIDLLNQDLTVAGSTNIATSVSNQTVTVTLNSTLTGLTEVDVGDLVLYENKVATQGGVGAVTIEANAGSANHLWTFGTDGNLAVAGKITNLTEPEADSDAATKHYVDIVAQGLHVHEPAVVATTSTLADLVSATVIYDNGTDGVGATLTLSSPITTIDNQAYPSYYFTSGSRILVKDQTDHKQNGIYTISANGLVLTRTVDFNNPTAVHGGDFVFVQYGHINGATGWVQTQDTDEIGVSNIEFVQFAGAGTYSAGDGLDLSGTQFSVKLATNSGLTTSGGSLSIDSGLAGDALSYGSGVLDVQYDNTSIGINGSNQLEIKSTWTGSSGITTLGTISSGTWHGDTLTYAYGGTGQTSYAKGDILYASASNTLSKLAAGTNGQTLQLQDGVPVWADLDGGTY